MPALARYFFVVYIKYKRQKLSLSLLNKAKKWTYCHWGMIRLRDSLLFVRVHLYHGFTQIVKHGIFSTSSNNWEPAAEIILLGKF